MRRILAVLALLALAATASIGGSQQIKEYKLFGGGTIWSATDSTAKASPWIPVRGASRVILRTWSQGADSNFADTLTAFTTLFSDSLCCIVSGTEGAVGSAQDSIVITGNAGDSTKFMGVYGVPITRPLNGAATGSGRLTFVYPISPNTPGSIAPDPNANAVIGAGYMRVYVTPKIRLTSGGSGQTAGTLRTSGVKGLRMRAFVVFENR